MGTLETGYIRRRLDRLTDIERKIDHLVREMAEKGCQAGNEDLVQFARRIHAVIVI